MTGSSADGGRPTTGPGDHYGVIELEGDETACALAGELVVNLGCLGMEETAGGGGGGEGMRLVAYFPSAVDLTLVLSAISRRVPACRARRSAPLKARDWLAEWKRSLSGFPLGERFYVVPTWLEAPDVARDVLRIDPEQAFGTGTHETTRLCAELLERVVEPEAVVLDIGTGTGILAMIAARLGAAVVHAFESDPAACECARANVVQNDLQDRITIHCRAFPDTRASFDASEVALAVANINSSVLVRVVPHLKAKSVILSGLLKSEVVAFGQALEPRYRVTDTLMLGEWAAIRASRATATHAIQAIHTRPP